MADTESDQCRALTADGERCTHTAQDDGFCHQHDADDPTIDDDTQDTTREASGGDSVSDSSESGTADGGGDESVGLIDVRDTVRSNAGQLIGHPFDGLVEVGRRRDGEGDPDGWTAVVEVIERKAVPDTQDILGRYEIDLNAQGEFQAYRRVQRLHRGDTGESSL